MAEMTGLHIVIVPAWWPSPEQPISGVFFADYARAFAAAGAKVGVIFPDLVSVRHVGRGTSIPWISKLAYEDVDGIPVIRIRGLHTALRMPWVQMHRYRRWLRRGFAAYVDRHGRPDLFHAMCTIPGAWACTGLDDPLARRVVITEHTGSFDRLILRRREGRYVRVGVDRAAALVAVSQPLVVKMRRGGVQREIDVIPNVVLDTFGASMPPVVSRDDKGRPVYRGIFVGRVTERKGIRELIEAALAIRQDARFSLRWHVVGYGPLEEEFKRRFEEARVGDRLVMHGLCEKAEVARLLRESHFLVLPSHIENCPLAICEALRVGRPVVATDGSSCEALVEEGDGYLVPIGDADRLAKAIRGLVLDYDRWDWTAISERARRRFSGPAVAAAYADVFRRVVSH